MAWELAARFFGLGTEQAELDAAYDDPLEFPAGVAALGRGGAGATGALLRHDGAHVGMLALADRCERGQSEVAALAEALPLGACQFLTVRWPVDAERAGASWRALARGRAAGAGVAATIADRYLPALVDAGWSEVRSLFVLARPDAETLHRDLIATADALPFPSRPATLAEVKTLAGDWFLPHAAGDVTIGWSITELTAEPPTDWAKRVLEDSVLAGVPTMLTLHLAPAGAPEPVSLSVRRQLQELDSAIEARRHHGRRADDLIAERRDIMATLTPVANPAARPRPARLLIACTVPSESARAMRDEVEPALERLGFRFAAHGPRLSRDLHLSCAPLCTPLVGRSLTLTSRGAALLTPQVANTADDLERRSDGLPLGLRRDGAAIWPDPDDGLLVTGGTAAASGLARTLALGAAARGARVAVVTTQGGWDSAVAASDGEALPIALHLGAALATLGAEQLRRPSGGPVERRIGDWAASMANLLADLCPDLAEDDLGDLTAGLMSLAEGALAWGEPLGLPALAAQLQGSGPAARHLATLLLSTTGDDRDVLRPDSRTNLVCYDASPDHAGERIAPPPGCAAVALRALLDHLATAHPDPHHPRILLLDDLTAILEATAGPGLLHQLLSEARRLGATVWCVASSLAACPRDLLATLREQTPTLVVSPDAPESLRLLARTLELPSNSSTASVRPPSAKSSSSKPTPPPPTTSPPLSTPSAPFPSPSPPPPRAAKGRSQTCPLHPAPPSTTPGKSPQIWGM
ncbi:MAG: hypothetical protein U0841_03380 [Chloroflexia bacterium]